MNSSFVDGRIVAQRRDQRRPRGRPRRRARRPGDPRRRQARASSRSPSGAARSSPPPGRAPAAGRRAGGTFTISNLGMFGVDAFDCDRQPAAGGDPRRRADRRAGGAGRRESRGSPDAGADRLLRPPRRGRRRSARASCRPSPRSSRNRWSFCPETACAHLGGAIDEAAVVPIARSTSPSMKEERHAQVTVAGTHSHSSSSRARVRSERRGEARSVRADQDRHLALRYRVTSPIRARPSSVDTSSGPHT